MTYGQTNAHTGHIIFQLSFKEEEAFKKEDSIPLHVCCLFYVLTSLRDIDVALEKNVNVLFISK